jgi:hypothetical protein
LAVSTLVSAPPTSVTVDHEPLKPVHEPFESGDESRCTTWVVASRPDPASVPQLTVSGIDSVL